MLPLDTLRRWLFCIASAQEGRHKTEVSLLDTCVWKWVNNGSHCPRQL
jgi:hypothetical protein